MSSIPPVFLTAIRDRNTPEFRRALREAYGATVEQWAEFFCVYVSEVQAWENVAFRDFRSPVMQASALHFVCELGVRADLRAIVRETIADGCSLSTLGRRLAERAGTAR